MDVIPHLERFVTEGIRVQGKAESKAYWRRCLALWSEKYGPEVEQHMRGFLNAQYRQPS